MSVKPIRLTQDLAEGTIRTENAVKSFVANLPDNLLGHKMVTESFIGKPDYRFT